MTVTDEIAARYLAVFHEPDPAARQAAVAALWSAGARLCTAANDYAGHHEITRRVTLAHEKFIVGQHMVFRLLGPAEAHHEGMRIRWEMAPAVGGDAVSGGTQFLLLDADGHIRFDYQFTDF